MSGDSWLESPFKINKMKGNKGDEVLIPGYNLEEPQKLMLREPPATQGHIFMIPFL